VDAYDLEKVEVVYKAVPGWQAEIGNARLFEELPVNAQAYIQRIEEAAGIPVKWIGVGPERDATIRR
jgi:adenylosuccinate synthase